jgi:hypothetical protein
MLIYGRGAGVTSHNSGAAVPVARRRRDIVPYIFYWMHFKSELFSCFRRSLQWEIVPACFYMRAEKDWPMVGRSSPDTLKHSGHYVYHLLF